MADSRSPSAPLDGAASPHHLLQHELIAGSSQADPPDTVVLLQMGGPATGRAVRPFLEALFRDPDIIRLPPLMRRYQGAFAKTVSLTRAPMVRLRYRSMGGGSPLNTITRQQAEALENALRIPVREVNRYTAPWAGDICSSLVEAGTQRVLVLPLYPHWSHTTTGSSLRDLHEATKRAGLDARIDVVRAWGDQPQYARLMADTCLQALDEVSQKTDDPVHLILSAHSLPERYIEEGDPYRREVEESARLVTEHLESAFASVQLGFQSAVGPLKWIGPETDELLERLAKDGARAVVLAPFGFVSDHIETRFDLDKKYRDQARKLGIPQYARAKSFNDDPAFIGLLQNLVKTAPRHALEEVVP